PDLVDRGLAVGHRPGGPLGLLVHRAVDRLGRVGQGVVVVAADHPVLTDGQLEDVGGLRLALADPGEHAQRLEVAALGLDLGLLARGRQVGGLLDVRRGRDFRLAVDDDRVTGVDNRLAIVVVDRLGRVAAVSGYGAPGRGRPDPRGGPAGGEPGAGIA